MKTGTALWILFFIFLVLKLTGTITWSWLLVTLPLWGGLAIVLVWVLLMAALAGIVWLLNLKK